MANSVCSTQQKYQGSTRARKHCINPPKKEKGAALVLQGNTGPTNRWSIGARLETLKDPIGTASRGVGGVVDRRSTTGMITTAALRVVFLQTGSTVKHFGSGWRGVDVPSPLGTFNPSSGGRRGTSRRMMVMAGTPRAVMLMTAVVIRSCGHSQTPVLRCLVQSTWQVAQLTTAIFSV